MSREASETTSCTSRDYVSFLSFCFRRESQAIGDPDRSPLLRADGVKRSRKHEYPGDHEVRYVWPEVEIDNRDLWVGGSPVLSWDDNGSPPSANVFVAWMNRAAAWRSPAR